MNVFFAALSLYHSFRLSPSLSPRPCPFVSAADIQVDIQVDESPRLGIPWEGILQSYSWSLRFLFSFSFLARSHSFSLPLFFFSLPFHLRACSFLPFFPDDHVYRSTEFTPETVPSFPAHVFSPLTTRRTSAQISTRTHFHGYAVLEFTRYYYKGSFPSA